VGIATAMNYVRMMSYQTKDLRTKMNAEKTLSQLQELAATPPGLAPQMAGPEAVVSQFVEMQMDGKSLNGERGGQMDAFLVHPVEWQHDKIGIARAFLNKERLGGSKQGIHSR
jgi:hypothetical protein